MSEKERELLCIHTVTKEIQDSLDKCFEGKEGGNPYDIRCLYTENFETIKKIFSVEGNECHTLSTLCDDPTAIRCFGAMVLDKKTRKIASYLLFSQKTVIKSVLAYLPPGEYPDFVNIDYLCTPTEYRRRGLSVLLQYIPILYAMRENMPVSADTNELSAPLLINKFGFTNEEDYLPQYNYMANTYLEPTISNKVDIVKRFTGICKQVK
jgi:hypothetical protein